MQKSISTNPKRFQAFVNFTRNSRSIPSQMTYGVMTGNCYKDVVDMHTQVYSFFRSM